MYFRNLVGKRNDAEGPHGGRPHSLKMAQKFWFDHMIYDLDYELFIFTSPKFQTANNAGKQRHTFLKMAFFELGNGYCNKLLNTEACCYDGGDCLLPYSCPTCSALKLMDDEVFVLEEKDEELRMSIQEIWKSDQYRFNKTHERRRFGDGICDEEYNR